MGDALYEFWRKEGPADLFRYDPGTGDLAPIHSSGRGEGRHEIVVFDWEAESDDLAPGYDEAAGDALFAMLVDHNFVDSDYLHLIGHSRGTVVISEAAQRLLSYDYDVHQVTFLDHLEPPMAPVWGEAGPPMAWEGIGFVDNYYGDGLPPLLGSGQGGDVAGAYNRGPDELIHEADIGAFIDLPHDGHVGHFEVREWYTQSIASAEPADVQGYGLRLRPENEKPPGQGDRAELVAPPTIVNGDFQYGPSGLPFSDDFAGWARHGGGGGGDIEGSGNHYLELQAPIRRSFPFYEPEAATRTHNRLYVPSEADRLEFNVRVADKGHRDELQVLFGNESIAGFPVQGPSETFQLVSIDVTDYRGSVQTLTLEIVAPGFFNRVDSTVHIDDLAFVSETNDPASLPVAHHASQDSWRTTESILAATDDFWARFGAAEQPRLSHVPDDSVFKSRLLAIETGMWLPTDDLLG
jgi:hypothetical protein